MAQSRYPGATNQCPLAGGQIGYNWQVNQIFVLGMEADIQYIGLRSTENFTRTANPPGVTL